MGEDRPTLPTVREGGAAAPASTGASPFDPPPVRFVEREELGRGGMGRVVEAMDRSLARPVAIKQALTADPLTVLRFEREVKITARLQHPAIVPILDAGRDAEGRPFYVMRKIEGRPLVDLVEQASVRERLALCPNVLAAIDACAYAHAQGIIHRDIKPWNVLVGSFGETLLIDWGLARELDGEDEAAAADDPDRDAALTRVGKAIGTPGFMAPEQARGELPDRRVDVYALGATLFHVLAGVPPHDGSSGTEAIASAAANRGADLSKVPSEVPAELVAIVAKAMAPVPADRYADAAELATDMRRFLAGQLVAAHDYTTVERLRKWAAKHRVAVAVAIASMLVISAISVLSVRNIIGERDAANEQREKAEAASALAVARGDNELVGRALAYLLVDPTATIAILKGLRPESELWAPARAIATAAASAGVASGYHAHTGRTVALWFSPDGQRVLSAGVDGQIVVRDLERKAQRVVRKGSPLRDAIWVSDATIAYLTDGPGVGVVDVASGEQREVAAGFTVDKIATYRGRLYARTTDNTVIDTAHPDTPVAHDAAEWHVSNSIMLVEDSHRLAWVGPTGEVTVPGLDKLTYLTVAVHATAPRFAVNSWKGTSEWTIVDGKPHLEREWPAEVGAHGEGTVSLFYTRDRLMLKTTNDVWWELAKERTPRKLPGDGYHGDAWDGFILGNTVVSADSAYVLIHRISGAGFIRGHLASPFVVLTSPAGELVTYDLRTFVPTHHRFWWPPGAELLENRGNVIWLRDPQQITRIDLATEKRTVFAVFGPPAVCLLSDDSVVTYTLRSSTIIAFDHEGQETQRRPGVTLGCVAGADHAIAIEPDGTVLEVYPTRVRQIAKVPGGHAVAANRQWLAIATDDHVVRIERATGRKAEVAVDGAYDLLGHRDAGIEDIAGATLLVDDGGVVYARAQSGLIRWDGRTERVVSATGVISALFPRPGGGVFVLAESSLFSIDTAGTIESTMLAPGAAPKVSDNGTMFVAIRFGYEGVSSLDLPTGVLWTLPHPHLRSVSVSPDGLTVAGLGYSAAMELDLMLWKVASPAPGDTRAWLDTLTNAKSSGNRNIVWE